MSAREEILARVRSALADADTSVVPVPRVVSTHASGRDLSALFVERMEEHRATVTRCSAADLEQELAVALPAGSTVVVPGGFEWRPPVGMTPVGDESLTAQQLDEVDAVVTSATVAIAETGTIVLTHGPGEGRRALSLVPNRHVCVVRAEQVVAEVPDAVGMLDPELPQTWISGPSATSDIELDRVEGVHGPRHLHVLLVSETGR